MTPPPPPPNETIAGTIQGENECFSRHYFLQKLSIILKKTIIHRKMKVVNTIQKNNIIQIIAATFSKKRRSGLPASEQLIFGLDWKKNIPSTNLPNNMP
jgi:hypothetical protein